MCTQRTWQGRRTAYCATERACNDERVQRVSDRPLGTTTMSYLSNSFLMMSTTSSGSSCMFFRLRSIVTPGLSSLLTPLASAAWVSVSWRAFFIASRARLMTWFAEIGVEADRPEAVELIELWNFSGIGGGGGGTSFTTGPGSRLVPPWPGVGGPPLEDDGGGGVPVMALKPFMLPEDMAEGGAASASKSLCLVFGGFVYVCRLMGAETMSGCRRIPMLSLDVLFRELRRSRPQTKADGPAQTKRDREHCRLSNAFELVMAKTDRRRPREMAGSGDWAAAALLSGRCANASVCADGRRGRCRCQGVGNRLGSMSRGKYRKDSVDGSGRRELVLGVRMARSRGCLRCGRECVDVGKFRV